MFVLQVEDQEYCVVRRQNGTTLYLPNTRWEYDENTNEYTFKLDTPENVPLKTCSHFFMETTRTHSTNHSQGMQIGKKQ